MWLLRAAILWDKSAQDKFLKNFKNPFRHSNLEERRGKVKQIEC